MVGWSDWIPFRLKYIKILPIREWGVYECKAGNKVVYIGKGNIRTRLLTHSEKKKFLDAVTHFHKRKTGRDEAKKTETRLLTAFEKKYGKRPLLNKQMPTKQSSLDKLIWG